MMLLMQVCCSKEYDDEPPAPLQLDHPLLQAASQSRLQCHQEVSDFMSTLDFRLPFKQVAYNFILGHSSALTASCLILLLQWKRLINARVPYATDVHPLTCAVAAQAADTELCRRHLKSALNDDLLSLRVGKALDPCRRDVRIES